METAALLLAAAVAAGAWWWLSRQGSSGGSERRLHHICLGDRAQAERLIEVERARAPGITRAEAIERAVARHQRDNR